MKNTGKLLIIFLSALLLGLLIISAKKKDDLPFKPDITVSKQGSKYKKISDAVKAVPSGNTKRFIIYITKGVYNEVLEIPADKKNISFIGESADTVKISFSRFAGEIKPDGDNYGTTGSTIVSVKAEGFTAENITFENSFDETKTPAADVQAVAIKTEGDKMIFKNCRFIGNQDTLYVRLGRQYFKDCYIEGDIDFIFSASNAYFENCRIHVKDRVKHDPSGIITAGSADAKDMFGFTFINCKFTADPGVKADSVYLGRPWFPSSSKTPIVVRTVLIKCELGAHIKKTGWTSMTVSGVTNLPENQFYREYKNTGDGANTAEALRKQLTDEEAAQYSVKNIFAGFNQKTDNWDPTTAVY